MKKIAILGSGTVGEVLANGFLQHGHAAMRGSREPAKLAAWKAGAKGEASTGTFVEAATWGEIIVLAVKGTATEAVVAQIAPQLAGKTVIDATNPIADAPPQHGVLQYFTSQNDSLMERLQKSVPAAHFVKAFNSVGHACMVNPKFATPPSMFICGNDAGAKQETTAILTTQPGSDSAISSMVAAGAATLQQGVVTEIAPSNLTPSLTKARNDKPQIYGDGCILSNGQVAGKDCFYGDTSSAITIALFGDSHAAQWFPALQEMALQNHWRLDVRTKKGCPTADIPIADPARGPECRPWRKKVITQLTAEHPDLIIMSAYRYTTTRSAVGANPDDVWRNGMQTTLDEMRPLATNVLVLGDTPTPLNDVPGCVASHLRHVSACMNPRAAAVMPGRLAVELDVAVAHHATFVPTGDWLCTSSECPVVIGNLLVYRDNSHITTATSMWLEPYLQAVVTPLLTG